MRGLRIILAALLSAAATFVGCSSTTSPYGSSPSPMPPLSSSEQQIESANNSFAASLFNGVAAQEQGKNFFISPLSVSMALAMTLNGASGQTYSDMQKTLGLGGLTNEQINQSYRSLMAMFAALDPGVTFNIANSIWYRNTFPLLYSFVYVDSTYFDAKAAGLNFDDPNSVDVINSWISDKTNGKISNVLAPPIPRSIMLYLINALYFHGTWQYRFDYRYTRLGAFHLPGGTTEADSMMNMSDTLNYYSDKVFSAVELPYGRGDYSMIVLLPEDTSSVAALPKLSQDELNLIFAGLKPEDVVVTLPRFNLEYSIELSGILSQLGMSSAFSPAADFSRMSPEQGLSISSVIHKTFIDVDESGTEAAAVTVVGIGTTVAAPRPYIFKADRPFLFLIKENRHNTIMFMGAITRRGVQSSD